jgi:hypothetical protein
VATQLDDLKQFRQWGSKTPGHPENFLTPGVEVTTGAQPRRALRLTVLLQPSVRHHHVHHAGMWRAAAGSATAHKL